jgi:hypothetical protein
MEAKNDLLNELESLSPLIAAMDKVKVFTVPPGYFDSLSYTVLAYVNEEQNPTTNNSAIINSTIPEGYFDQLAASILDKIKNEKTAKEETESLSPLLSSLQHHQVFEVPKGYFEQLTNDVNKSIGDNSSNELKELSPVLQSLQKVNVFEVPTGYFENLSTSILKKAKAPSARIINFKARNYFLKYAAAAIITGVIAMGALRYLQPSQSANTIVTPLAMLDESIEKGKTMNDQQFEESLKKLTSVDIAKYLENNGDITDVATLRNNIDEYNLPNEDDYILNEKTLENFIKEINNNSIKNN